MGPAFTSIFESTLGIAAGTMAPAENPELEEMIGALRENPTPKVPVATDAMLRALDAVGHPVLQKWYWPEARSFCVCLSHDVDEVRWSWRRRLLMAGLHPRTVFEPNDHYWNFDRVLELERSFRVKSSWYFVANGKHPRDPPYSLRDVAEVMRNLQEKGQEVGVHGSFLSYRDERMLQMEREVISQVVGRPIPGIRQHFVNFEAPLTWKIQESVGFSYDTTLALNRTSGFRVGLCHPYRPSGYRILELPLILGDWQLFWYERLNVRQAVENCERLAREVADRHGLLTMNWHQQTYDGYSFPGWWDVYEHMLKWLSDRNPVFMTSEQVWRWWAARDAVLIERKEQGERRESWQIMAPKGIQGLTVRMAGLPSANFATDVEHMTVTQEGGNFLILTELQPGEPETVTVEW